MTSIQRAALSVGLLALWTAPWLVTWQEILIGIVIFLLGIEALADAFEDWKERKVERSPRSEEAS